MGSLELLLLAYRQQIPFAEVAKAHTTERTALVSTRALMEAEEKLQQPCWSSTPVDDVPVDEAGVVTRPLRSPIRIMMIH